MTRRTKLYVPILFAAASAAAAAAAAAAWVPSPPVSFLTTPPGRHGELRSPTSLSFFSRIQPPPQTNRLCTDEEMRIRCRTSLAARTRVNDHGAAEHEAHGGGRDQLSSTSSSSSRSRRPSSASRTTTKDNSNSGTPTSGRRIALGRMASVAMAGVSAGSAGGVLSTTTASAATTTTTTVPGNDAPSGQFLNDSNSASSSDISVLRARIEGNVLAQPNYGMDGVDVLYPSWFQGNWKVTSTTLNVSAPCGTMLFGGNSTYQRAKDEIGTSLVYSARFVPYFTGSDDAGSAGEEARWMIADRDYNVRSIAQAAIGPNSVVNVDKATPNEFVCTLLSGGSSSNTDRASSSNNNMFRINMLTVQRKQELLGRAASVDPRTFACAEVVQEVIRPIGSSAASASTTNPILKQVETISVYSAEAAGDDPTVRVIECLQRTASYLVPSQNDPIMAQLSRATQGLPVDVRHYAVTYRKEDEKR